MKCKNCNFDNLGIELITREDIKEIESDEEEELRCEYCGTDLIPQLKEVIR